MRSALGGGVEAVDHDGLGGTDGEAPDLDLEATRHLTLGAGGVVDGAGGAASSASVSALAIELVLQADGGAVGLGEDAGALLVGVGDAALQLGQLGLGGLTLGGGVGELLLDALGAGRGHVLGRGQALPDEQGGDDEERDRAPDRPRRSRWRGCCRWPRGPPPSAASRMVLSIGWCLLGGSARAHVPWLGAVDVVLDDLHLGVAVDRPFDDGLGRTRRRCRSGCRGAR